MRGTVLTGGLPGQVAGEDEVDASTRDESLPNDQDFPVWLDKHDRCLAAPGRLAVTVPPLPKAGSRLPLEFSRARVNAVLPPAE
jgi:hypothetical protein